MALKEFIDKITTVEHQLNLTELQVNGFNPWPYMRLVIFSKYKLLESEEEQATTKKIEKKISNIGKVFSLGKSLLMYLSNPIKKKDIDILYFTRQSENSNIGDNGPFNKYSDSFKYFFSKDYRIKVLEICDQAQIKGKNKDITYIDFLIKITRIKYKLLLKIKSPDTQVLNDINVIIEKEFGFQIDAASDLLLIYYLSEKYVKILKHYNPKLVFLTAFYCSEAMAMNLACHQLGIIVVEYQHGAQNDYHPMYTHWENLPEEGYELIPNTFWMWGKEPQRRIENWTEKTTKHNALVGGNIWMTYVSERKSDVAYLASHYNNSKINILISLQGDQIFPKFLLESIKNDSSGIIWHFRDHPRLPISDILKNKIIKLSNCEITFSSQAPLYELIKKSDIHITGYSTVAFEAQSFNIPTIFTHINALNGYQELMNKNGLFYADNGDSFNALIIELLSNKLDIESAYIVSNLMTHSDALSLLME